MSRSRFGVASTNGSQLASESFYLSNIGSDSSQNKYACQHINISGGLFIIYGEACPPQVLPPQRGNMSNTNIEKEKILKLNDRIQVKVIYRYEDNIIGKREEFLFIFTIENQKRRPEIKVDIETGEVDTSLFSFELLHFQEDLKTIFDYISGLKFKKNIFNY